MNNLLARLWSVFFQKKCSDNSVEDLDFENFSTITRHGVVVILLFFGVLGGWATLGEISGAVVVPGTVKIDTERKTVQHLEGGIVDLIHVREGDKVKKGQALVVLRSASVDSSVDMANKNLILLISSRNRWQAEKDMLQSIIWDDELVGLVKKHNGHDTLLNEKKLFDARRISFKSQTELLDTQIKQLAAQSAGLGEELAAEKIIIGALTEELSAKRKLMEKKYLEKSKVLELERQLASHRGTHGKLRQSIAAAEQQKSGLELQKDALIIRIVEQASTEINSLDSKILQTREQLLPLQDTKRRLEVVAPVAGRVVGLQIHSPGGVIAPGQNLLDIVPENTPLVAEVHIPVDKIAEVYEGQEAQAQLDAFDRQTTPLIQAKVLHIAADRQEEQTSMGMVPFYLSHVQLYPNSVDTSNIYLSPGMPVTVFITTNKRTVLYYMIEPLLKSWDRALRE